MNNLKIIKKEIFDIKSDLDDGKDCLSVCMVYTNYSVGMIRYIESKRKSVLESLFSCIAEGIQNKLSANELITLRIDGQLKNYIISRLYESELFEPLEPPDQPIDLSDERIEIQFLFNCIRIYQSLPAEQKTEIFNTWYVYERYDNIRNSFDQLNIRKLYNIYCKIKSKLENNESPDTIYGTMDEMKDHRAIVRFMLCEIKNFKWRENQRHGWQNGADTDFINAIHSQATGSGKSLIALKEINEYNKRYPTHDVMWICERKDIPQKLFFNGTVECGDGMVSGIPHKKNYEFWQINDIIDMSKFHVIEHIYNKNSSWVQDINSYVGTKPIFLIINRAFMTGRVKIYPGAGKTADNKHKYQEIIRIPRFVVIDECHSSMSNQTYKLLLHLKHNTKSKIHGFSATPYRTGKSYTDINIRIDTDTDISTKENEIKLLKIFHDPMDENKLNILSFFNLKDAIEEGIILEPVFHWYYLEPPDPEKKIEYNAKDIMSVLRVIKSVLKKCKYKKCIVWCGTIAIAEEWKRIFEEWKPEYRVLKDMQSYIDHSKTKNNDYDKFYNTSDNCIMFCANKFREGSDIPYLSCCVFLDKVMNRGLIPFIQYIGRVLRRDTENEKKHGMVLDGCIKTDNQSNVKNIVLKILKYYEYLYDMGSFEVEEVDIDANINTFNEIKSSIDTDPETRCINIRLRNNKTLKIDIAKLKLSSLEWKKIIPTFTKQLKKQFLRSDYAEYRTLREYCQHIQIPDKYYYEREYKCYPDLCVGSDDEIRMLDIRARFPGYFKNWYDFLGTDTGGFIQRLDCWRHECRSRGILNTSQYMELCTTDKRFPNMPDEFYKGFTNIEYEFNNLSTGLRR